MLNADGRTTSLQNCYKKLYIKPGYGTKDVLEFPGEGHQTVHGMVSNLYFRIEEIHDSVYTRRGTDLIYTHKLSLAEALSCSSIDVVTLDQRVISVSLD
jgi:DnaJ family protein B protein 4